ISALDLHEVSLVPFPSHPEARISTVKGSQARSATEEVQMDPEETAVAPEVATLEKKMGEITETVKDFGKITERLDRVEARLNRPGAVEQKADNDTEVKAFMSFVRKGESRLTADETKSMTVANNDAIAPEQFTTEVLKALRQFSPIRQFAKVITI